MFLKKIIFPGTFFLLVCGIAPMANAKFFWEKEKPKTMHHTYVFATYGSYNIDNDEISDDKRYSEVGIGARLSRHFGVEGVYSDFGEVSGKLASANISGVSANVIGFFPFNSYLDMYLKGGIFFANFDLDVNGENKSYKDEQPNIGVGLNIKVNEPLTLFAEFSRYSIKIERDQLPEPLTQTAVDINTFKIGAKYVF